MNLIIERLIECREKKGLSKQETAKRVGLSQPAYLRYESGERTPSLHVIKEIAKVLQTSADYLIGISDNPDRTIIEINRNDDKDLFAIIELASGFDTEQKKRLLAYAEKLSNS